MRISTLLIALAGLAVAPAVAMAQPAACTREDFSRIVNETGSALRAMSARSHPQIQAELKRLKERQKWTAAEEEQRTRTLFSDATSEALDERSARLLAELDRLAETDASQPPDCKRLETLKATAQELRQTIEAKAEHIRRKLQTAVAETVPAAPPPPTGRQQPANAPATLPAPAAPRAAPTTAWKEPSVRRAPLPPPPLAAPGGSTIAMNRAEPPPPLPPPTTTVPPPAAVPEQTAAPTYNIDEVRAAARNVFGSISSNLASVIEHAFATLGRPTGYVLGQEGGAAFVAGIRYGKGKLFLKGQPPIRVHWHGPSVGYDFGAAQSQTLFLVYRLRNPDRLFSGFTGVDGSAYVVGGVGITFLTDGKVILAPIRSGVGLRVGASIGYIRFTARPTWNPF